MLPSYPQEAKTKKKGAASKPKGGKLIMERDDDYGDIGDVGVGFRTAKAAPIVAAAAASAEPATATPSWVVEENFM